MTYSSLRDYFLKKGIGEISKSRRKGLEEVFHVAGCLRRAVPETLSRGGERYIKPSEKDNSNILDDISIAGISNWPISLIQKHTLDYYKTLGYQIVKQNSLESNNRSLTLRKDNSQLMVNITQDMITNRVYITSQLIN